MLLHEVAAVKESDGGMRMSPVYDIFRVGEGIEQRTEHIIPEGERNVRLQLTSTLGEQTRIIIFG